MARNERSRPHHKGDPANTTTSAPPIIPNPAVEPWVIFEKQQIDEARAARLVLWLALGLRGHRHDDHPNVWNPQRVGRLELRRRRKGAA